MAPSPGCPLSYDQLADLARRQAAVIDDQAAVLIAAVVDGLQLQYLLDDEVPVRQSRIRYSWFV
ncbi:MAG: hypothetical protein LBE08_13775 [Bifidobacteriaceae bacterium]|nr:hypothetical protein [Bifidobacteriaceae bacterium]